MAAKQDNYLKGFCRQLRQAIDDGAELAYEFAELVVEAEDLIDGGPDDGDGTDVDEMDGSDGDGSEDTRSEPRGGHRSGQDPQLDVPGLVRGMDSVPDPLHSHGGVPRGTGSGASPAVTGSLYDAAPVTYTARRNPRRGT